MKAFAKIVLAIAAAGSCAAAAAQTYDSQADQERRARNRDEAVAAWERQHDRDTVTYEHHDAYGHESVGQKLDHGVASTESFTHRQLNKMRRFSDRQNARYHAPDQPVHEDNKRPTAMGSNKP